METIAKVFIISAIAYVGYKVGKLAGKIELAKDVYKAFVNDVGEQKV